MARETKEESELPPTDGSDLKKNVTRVSAPDPGARDWNSLVFSRSLLLWRLLVGCKSLLDIMSSSYISKHHPLQLRENTSVVSTLPGGEVTPNFPHQELPISNRLVIFHGYLRLIRERGINILSPHAERCIQRLDQRVKVGLEEEGNPGGNQVSTYPTRAGLKTGRKLTKH